MKIKINHNIKLKSIFVHNYLWLGLLFWFTPVHEMGHVLICWCTGATVTSIDWWHSVWHTVTSWDWIHHIYEYTYYIPFVLIGFWILFNYKHTFLDKQVVKDIAVP